MKNTIIFTAFWLMTMLNAFANIVPDTIHNNEPKSCSVSLPNDSVINSLGESINVQIDMPPNWGYYFWSSSNGTIVNINSQNNFAFATIDATTTFYFTALFPEGDNLISNGDFELGNTGFYTQYLLPNQSPICYGTYLITDHTSAFYTSTQGNCLGDGLFMCVDGAITANKIVYQQQVIVEPNTYYFFQIDVANINNSQNAMYRPIFNFSINSTPVCDTFEVTTNWCEWQTFYDLWYSGSATQATIIIIDDNTSSDGNDFAIDNISLFKMCQVTDSITFYVNGSPCNYTADLGIDLTVCQGDSVRLWNRTSDTGTCQWSINDYEGDTLTFVANSTQTIYLIMLDSNGCTASASVVVNVQNPPQITFSGDTIICAGGSTTLTASADVSNCTFAWNNGSTGNEIIVSPNIPTTYSVTATTQPLGCSSTAEVSVNIQSPQVTAGNDVNICAGETATITASGIVNTYHWRSIPDDASLTDIYSASIEVKPTQTTIYIVRGEISEDCYDEDTMTVFVNPLPIASIGYTPSSIDYLSPTINFTDNSTNSATRQWIISDGTITTQASFSHVFDLMDNSYNIMLIATSSNDCVDTAVVNLSVMRDHFLFAPNAVCPTANDPKNNSFRIYIDGVQDFELTIYNRYGGILWQANDINQSWDCRYNNAYVQTGVYCWKAKYSHFDSPTETKEAVGSFIVFY